MPNEMYEEYGKAYRVHASKYGLDTAIFYQVGKFYEFYDWIDPVTGSTQTSMKRFVDILGVRMSLRKGDGPKGSDALFAGVPEQSLHKYAATLTRVGWVVVVYDQVKDWKGAVASREVARILTPGTHVEALNEADANKSAFYFAGVWFVEPTWGSKHPPQFACVCLDLTTGKSITHEGVASGKAASWTTDEIFHFFQVYLPKECVVWWKGSSPHRPSATELQRKFGLPGVRLEIMDANEQGGFEIPMVREEFLQRSFSVQSLLSAREALRLGARPLTERVLCVFFQRVQEHYPSGLKRLHWPQQWIPSMNLSLGNQALFQLNMVTPKMEDSVLGMFQRTYTAFGLRAMRRRLLYPTADRAILRRRYAEIQTIFALDAGSGDDVRRNLRQIDDLPRLHRRIAEGEISAAEITLLDKSYICARRISESTFVPPPSAGPIPFEKLMGEFHEIFSVEKASKSNENTFCFQNSAAPEVATIEKEIQSLYEILNSVVTTLNRSAKTDGLRLEFREVLAPIITGNKASMTSLGVILKGASQPFPGIQFHQKKSSAHVEIPILEKTFHTILKKREELGRAVKVALMSLCGKFADSCGLVWDALESWIENVDVTCTIATVSKERGLTCPILAETEESYIEVNGLRHPLIEACMSRTEYVAHSVHLGGTESGGWLVYGMNASGKSSLMKAVGIALILAQSGCFVPATNFRFVPFRTLFTRILNTDNLWAGLSSFAVEMTELREILQRADEYSLVLGDEVCSGTESVSATAIVGASLKCLHGRRSKFIFATHLHNLDTILEGVAAIWHLKVRYEPVEDCLIYERTLTPGPGSSLYGLEVARAMNLPDEVLGTAHMLRRKLLGIQTEQNAPTSAWNSAIQKRECEMCGKGFVKDLEVHHIRPRRDATDGVFADGSQQDHVRNLVTVCSECHDAYHAEKLVIGPLVQTSDGAKRIETRNNEVFKTVRRAKWTDEQVKQIQEYLKTHPMVLPKRAVFDLGEFGITISASALKKFR
uniref:DNA mismatch repair proteins mutS family domain-containing protein n=1 Tax=viral metagenome TaxID=1070528 RepID=A0A6C0K573_9ZZZZ